MPLSALKLAPLLTLLGLGACGSTPPLATPQPAPLPVSVAPLVTIQVLGFNDFHGALEPPAGAGGRIRTGPDRERDWVDAGGAEALAARLSALRAEHPHTVVVAAGDLVGGSPLLSGVFHDEPAIESLNAMGLDLAAVGNHEFDEGWRELLRLQSGGCHPTDGCQDGDPFTGAKFKYLAANVRRKDSGETVFPGSTVRVFGGARVGFIGLTLTGTPTVTLASGVEGLLFEDAATAINRETTALVAQGVKAIVVMIHEGGETRGLYNACEALTGPILEVVKHLHPQVDAVFTGHSHQAYNCVLDGKIVTSAAAGGRLVTRLLLSVDPVSGEVKSAQAENLIAGRDLPPDPQQTALIARYGRLAAPLANRVIGRLQGDLSTRADATGQMPMGLVIADAQLHATSAPANGGAVITFMNPGGVRADLVAAQISGGEQPGEVTYGEAFTVHPFGNLLVTFTLTGEGLHQALEQQWSKNPDGSTRFRALQVSRGFAYAFTAEAPQGQRIDPASLTLDGRAIDPKGAYRVTVNSFLADGGDNFKAFGAGTDRVTGAVDLDALEGYLRAHSPLPVPVNDRVRRVTSPKP